MSVQAPKTVEEAIETARGRRLFARYLRDAHGGETFGEWLTRPGVRSD